MAERIKIVLETGNAAFEDNPATELARILETLAANIREGDIPQDGHPLKDINGNTVGNFFIWSLPSGN